MEKVSIRFYNDHEVRAVWSEEDNKWFFSVLDVLAAINNQDDYQKTRNYWKYLKTKLKKDSPEVVSATTQLKLRAADGKRYNTYMLDANGVILLKFISGQLRRELPGLRGFSENNLKNMRKFYEAWKVLDKTTTAIVESLNMGKHIDIQHMMTCQSTCARLFPICRR